MHNLEKLFNKENLSTISDLIEDKMSCLNQIPEFKEKDKKFATAMENFENSLSEDLRKNFDNVIKLSYQLDEYYFTLAYFLGKKSGEQSLKF